MGVGNQSGVNILLRPICPTHTPSLLDATLWLRRPLQMKKQPPLSCLFSTPLTVFIHLVKGSFSLSNSPWDEFKRLQQRFSENGNIFVSEMSDYFFFNPAVKFEFFQDPHLQSF